MQIMKGVYSVGVHFTLSDIADELFNLIPEEASLKVRLANGQLRLYP